MSEIQDGNFKRKEMPTPERSKYTLCYDYLRTIIGPEVSRSECAQMVEMICEILKFDNGDFVTKVSEYYVANKDSIDDFASKKTIEKILRESQQGNVYNDHI